MLGMIGNNLHNQITHGINIVRVITHDIAVFGRIKIFDWQPLHMNIHIISKFK